MGVKGRASKGQTNWRFRMSAKVDKILDNVRRIGETDITWKVTQADIISTMPVD